MSFWTLLSTFGPVIVEAIRMYMAKSAEAKELARQRLNAKLISLQDAIKKADDTGGDTSAIEQIINEKEEG